MINHSNEFPSKSMMKFPVSPAIPLNRGPTELHTCSSVSASPQACWRSVQPRVLMLFGFQQSHGCIQGAQGKTQESNWQSTGDPGDRLAGIGQASEAKCPQMPFEDSRTRPVGLKSNRDLIPKGPEVPR